MLNRTPLLLFLFLYLIVAMPAAVLGQDSETAVPANVRAICVLDSIRWGESEAELRLHEGASLSPFGGTYLHPTESVKFCLKSTLPTETGTCPYEILFCLDDRTGKLRQVVIRPQPDKQTTDEPWFVSMKRVLFQRFGRMQDENLYLAPGYKISRFTWNTASSKIALSLIDLNYRNLATLTYSQLSAPDDLDNTLKLQLSQVGGRIGLAQREGNEDPLPLFENQVRIYKQLATLYYQEGRYEEAAMIYGAIVSTEQIFLCRKDPELAVDIRYTGTLCRSRGQLLSAENFFARALDLQEKSLGASHSDLAPTLKEYIQVEQALSKPQKAQALQDKLQSLRRNSP